MSIIYSKIKYSNKLNIQIKLFLYLLNFEDYFFYEWRLLMMKHKSLIVLLKLSKNLNKKQLCVVVSYKLLNYFVYRKGIYGYATFRALFGHNRVMVQCGYSFYINLLNILFSCLVNLLS